MNEKPAIMNIPAHLAGLEVGFDIPALPGMNEAEIQTPCLVLDLDALERNITKMGEYAEAHGIRLRVHCKMHKSVDVARLQERLGGSVRHLLSKGLGSRGFRPEWIHRHSGHKPSA